MERRVLVDRYRIHPPQVSLQDEPVFVIGLRAEVALPTSGSPFVLDLAHTASAAADAAPDAVLEPIPDITLLERDAFLGREAPALVEDLSRQLDALWIERFCAEVASPEAAARCIYGPLHSAQVGANSDPRIQAALGTLRTALGEDLRLLLATHPSR